jgi:hypothetical protein
MALLLVMGTAFLTYAIPSLLDYRSAILLTHSIAALCGMLLAFRCDSFTGFGLALLLGTFTYGLIKEAAGTEFALFFVKYFLPGLAIGLVVKLTVDRFYRRPARI